MSKKSGPHETAERYVKDIKRRTRWKFSAEEKIRIVLEGLRGEYSIAELCRREGIAQGLYHTWSKAFMETGKRRLSRDTERQATTGEVTGLKREMRDLKEVVADLTLENRVQKKRDRGSPLVAPLVRATTGDAVTPRRPKGAPSLTRHTFGESGQRFCNVSTRKEVRGYASEINCPPAPLVAAPA